MIDGLLGRKLGMTQVWAADGRLTPVTVLSVGPCKVVQVKSVEKEGYAAAQISFDEIEERKLTRPLRGHFKKANLPPARQLKEFKGDLSDVVVGQEITAAIFKAGELVDVTGVSKGKGFQGVMKRHHYRGGPATHGSMFHRAPGSIGASSFPSRVWKNKGMPGHMGGEQITTQGLEIIAVRPDDHLIFVKGSVPGSITGRVAIYRSIKKVRVKQAQSTKPVNAAKAGKVAKKK